MASSPIQPDAAFALSLVRDDPLFRLQRRLGLIPPDGLGIARRAIFWALFAWVPLAVSAWIAKSLVGSDEALLAHYGVNVRLLVAVPLLIVAEAGAHRITHVILPQFVRSGLVADEARPAYRQVLADMSALRDRIAPWLLIAAFVVTGTLIADALRPPHELEWSGRGGLVLQFGAFWYRHVAQPLYVVLVLAWLWRMALFVLLLGRVAGMGLTLVPTHPDKAGGLGFLERVPAAFAPVVLAMSAVLASRWAHDVVHHGLDVRTLWPQIAMFVVLVLVVFCLPLLVFAGPLLRTKRQALLDYGTLTARHGRMVHDRWILGRTVDDPILDAPELGPVVDIGAAHDAVVSMRAAPIGKSAIAPLAIAAAVPMLALVGLQVPIVDVLKKLLAALA